MTESEASIIRQFIRVSKAHRQLTEHALQQLGLHVGQEQTLFQLWEADGLTQSQLAQAACVDMSTMSKMMERMESAGWLQRRQDPEDARISRVYLTEQGRALREPVAHLWSTLEARLVQGLTASEQMLLRRLLIQMAANLA